MTDDARQTRREGLAELAEDAVGFGGQELRLTRDLLLRPHVVMDAYDAHGSTAGGLYPKPLRYYLTLMGLYVLAIALVGGFERQMSGESFSTLFTPFAANAGKTLAEFQSDFEQWYSLLSVPVTAFFFGGATYLLIRKWSPANDRQDFRQTFTYLNAFSVLGIPCGFVAMLSPSISLFMLPLSFFLMALTYARVGGGRWWRTRTGAWGKGALLLLVNLVAYLPAVVLLLGLSIGGARLLP